MIGPRSFVVKEFINNNDTIEDLSYATFGIDDLVELNVGKKNLFSLMPGAIIVSHTTYAMRILFEYALDMLGNQSNENTSFQDLKDRYINNNNNNKCY